ncbi:hypothetical protein EV292_106200 [Sphingomonas sp. BK235]|nr:hypothetical protein EV292_106200 [Sphingomonas sp. BK235]
MISSSSGAARADGMTPAEREQQRVAHLVLGAPRPRAKVSAKRKKTKVVRPIALAAGVEEAVALRECWSHKAEGTPETHEKHKLASLREGCLARLHRTGAIDTHQLAAAERINAAHQLTIADVAVRTARFEPRGSGGGPDAASAERISAVLLERSYTVWRAAVAPHTAMLLAIIVDDMALTAAGRRWRLSDRRARAILIAGLNTWR